MGAHGYGLYPSEIQISTTLNIFFFKGKERKSVGKRKSIKKKLKNYTRDRELRKKKGNINWKMITWKHKRRWPNIKLNACNMESYTEN